MIRAIKAVSTERGRDPREFALFAFGGNGPLFAAGMAAALGISARGRAAVAGPVLVLRPALRRRRASLLAHLPAPAAPGRPRRDRARPGTRWREQASDQLAAEGFTGAARAAQALGGPALQGPELRADRAGARRPDRRRAWSRTSRRPSARSTSAPTAIAPAPTSRSSWSSIQVVGQGLREGTRRAASASSSSRRRAAPQAAAPRLFRRRDGWLETPVLRRSDLAARRAGPLIVEEYDATCVVPPGARAELDGGGNIVITLAT